MVGLDYSNIIALVAELVGYCFPFSLIFGVTAKLCNIAFDMIVNKRIDM